MAEKVDDENSREVNDVVAIREGRGREGRGYKVAAAAEDYPPNSRLFVICNKSNSEPELREAFGRYGHLEDVRILIDHHTGQSKGIAYVKFAKTSQAAEALECLHGTTLENNERPLKVMVANDRSKGCTREPNEEDRLFRLFVIVSKDVKEKALKEDFEHFGGVSDVRILKDRKSGESKGVAYVRFVKASHAAVAFENCDKSYKAKFAEPRPKNTFNNRSNDLEPPITSGYRSHHQGNRMDDEYAGRPFHDVFDQKFPMSDRLQVVASAGVTQQQLWKLFDLIPGLEYCDVHMRSYESDGDPVFATVKYRTSQSSSLALNKLNNFEYPPGKPLAVREASDSNTLQGRSAIDLNVSAVTSDVAKLADALAHAHSVMKAAGLSVPTGVSQDDQTSRYSLPRSSSPKPMDVCDTVVEQRLFVVCHPTVLPYDALYEVFGRFNGLANIRILNGKKYGFVTYTKEESARRAIEALNGQNIRGVHLTVKVADPPDSDRTSSIGTKRQKIN